MLREEINPSTINLKTKDFPMTNEEKYETADERNDAHQEFCMNHDCADCPANKNGKKMCTFYWLSLEADELD